MLEHLKRYIAGAKPPQPATLAETPKETTMENQDAPALVVQAPAQDAGLQATVETLTAALADANAQVAELTALVAQATEFQAEQLKVAAEAKSASRLSQLATLLGDSAAATMNQSLAALGDEAFNGVVASLGVRSKTEAETPLFSEVGVDGEVDAVKLADDTKSTGVMNYLTNKYKAN